MYESLATRTPRLKPAGGSGESKSGCHFAVYVRRGSALVFAVEGGEIVSEREITCDLPPRHRTMGGVRAPAAYSERSLNSEHSDQRWRESITKKFFEEIHDALSAADRIIIMGSGKLRNQLQNYLADDRMLRDRFDGQAIALGRLTPNQLRHSICDYFSS